MAAFRTFSTAHLTAVLLILAAGAGLAATARFDRSRKYVKPLSLILATVAVGHELIWIATAVVLGKWHYSWGLPLQLCDLAIFLVAACLIRHVQWMWELGYFWGLGGSLQAVLTPDLGVMFPDIRFIKFFLSHGCIVVGVIFLAAGLRRPITFRSVLHVFVITNVYGWSVLLFNHLAGTNYMYLNAKPSQPSLLDLAGEGPMYYAGLEGLLVLSLLIYYLPYFFVNRRWNC